ncbi:MAG TPA: MnhB domain-containing protein [Jatrophihabitans sp.]|jgi:multicomponent Na+:H+ antiporter subunit B|nr:MnhB domain-containing protein [Jatrophihabitans sp.]
MSDRPAQQADEGWHRPGLGVAVVAAVAAVVAVGLIALPRDTAALPAIARHAMRIALPRWGTTEGVNEIVYGSRGFDTFGETFLLLAAVVAVVLLARGPEPRAEYVGEASAGRAEQAAADPEAPPDQQELQARRAEQEESEEQEPAPDHADEEPLGTPAPERSAAMTVIVRAAARVAAVPLAVAGVYLAAWGYAPGGGFPAGAVLTGVALLLYAALGHRAVGSAVRPAVLEPLELFGAAAIVAIGTVGAFVRGSFLQNWLPLAEQQTIRAGGTLQAFSGAELVEVGTGLTIAIFALLGMRHEWAGDEDES